MSLRSCFVYFWVARFTQVLLYMHNHHSDRARSVSVVECLIWDRGPQVWASLAWLRCVLEQDILILVQPRKTRPYITERLLMGRKESIQTNKQTIQTCLHSYLVGLKAYFLFICLCISSSSILDGERSGSVVECLTRDRRAAGSSLTGVTALWSLSKTHLS